MSRANEPDEATKLSNAGNILEGAVAGTAVQAGTVHGGVHVHQAPQADLPVPHQLPAPPARFVGREAELAEIDRLVSQPHRGPGVVVISGVGGIGKSALALTWAHQARTRYPDGHLYADLGAFDPTGPVDPGTILGHALRSLGVAAERVPTDTAELAAMFRTIAAGKGLLVLLDNAVSAAQVRPLLPPSPSCVVLVTARWRLGGLFSDGAAFLGVEPLPEDAATQMLARSIGHDRTDSDPASTSALIRLCAGLPIALTVTGARLATRPRWPIRRVVDELTQEHRRLHGLGEQHGMSVRGVFDMSYRELSAPVARCYRVLGLHPGAEFGTPVVAAALGVDVEEAAGLLDALLEANMLGETAVDRYRLHDLVRLHARQYANADPYGSTATWRILEWYLAGTLAADVVLTPYRHRDPDNPFELLDASAVVHADRRGALDWLEAERANLVAAVQHAAQDLPLLAWRIADSMWPLFHYRRHHHDRMLVDRIAVECAQRLADRDREARMVRRWAFAHLDVGRLDEARELFERSQRLCEELSHRYGVASAVEGLGMVAVAQRRYADALTLFGRQERLCRDLGEHRRTGLALLNLGVVHNELAQHQQAVRHLRESAAVFAGLGDVDPYNEVRVSIELGRALGNLGERRQARTRLAAALRDMRRLGSPRGEAGALHRLGELALAQEEFTEARVHLAEALQIYRDLADAEAEQVKRLAALVPPAKADPDRMT